MLVAYTDNSWIEKVTASNSDYGICLDSSSGNAIIGNTVSGNHYGICLSSSSNNDVTDNNASDNWDGIRLRSSNNNSLTGNSASDNGDSIYLYSSSNNRIYHNNLYGNAREYSRGNNRWNTTTAGNYYTGNDTDGDGIGDDPTRSRAART